jgi:hypothetical protein
MLPADCWSTPHLIHVGVASVAIVAFVALACVFTMAEIELNPVSTNPIGMAHTKCAVCDLKSALAITISALPFTASPNALPHAAWR